MTCARAGLAWLGQTVGMSVAVPSGTVTFLFTDLEGSTALWDREPVAMEAALERHDELIRGVIALHGGHVFATGGDGFCVAFSRARAGVITALELQRAIKSEAWPTAAPLKVRIGLHSGEVTERDGNYFGASVNRAARLMSLARGGEVFLSLATAQLVRETLDQTVELVDLGSVVLRGFDRPEQVFALRPAGLFEPVVPLQSKREVRGNLPLSVTSFVGRVDDVKGLVLELRRRKLVSLVGVGGVGKTRLSLEVAWQLADEFPDGVWLCELAALADGDSVVNLLLSTLGLRLQPGMSAVDSFVDGLNGRSLLLVLDNCEHVLDRVADVARGIAGSCPGVTVLLTSREPLGVEGERVWPVRSLDPAVEGVQLFVERASEGGGSDDADRVAIEELCTRLDGIPLAIELAAVRARTMSVGEILDRLGQRFRLLRGSVRGRVERHQTLQATVQWSYDLLSDAERLLFDRLSVFSGSFDAAAVYAVCTPELDEFDVADQLGALVDRSMVVVDRSQHRHTRYRLLETLRQFGALNVSADEAIALRDRHAEHFVGIAEHAGDRWQHDGYAEGELLFASEWDNIRSAVEWGLGNGDLEQCARVLRALALYAPAHMQLDCREWAYRGLTQPNCPSVFGGVAAILTGLVGDFAEQIRLGEATLASASPDDPDLHCAWGALSGGYGHSGPFDKYEIAVERAFAFACRTNPVVEAYWTVIAASVAKEEHDAEALIARAHAVERQLGHPYLRAHVLAFEALFESKRGRFARARQVCQDALLVANDNGLTWAAAQAWNIRARIASKSREPDALPIFDDAISAIRSARSWFDMWPTLAYLAVWLTTQDSPCDAALITGHLEEHGMSSLIATRVSPTVLSGLTDQEFDDERTLGASLNRDALVAEVLTRLRVSVSN